MVIFQFAQLVSLPGRVSPSDPMACRWGKPASKGQQISVMDLSTVGVDRFYIFLPVAILIPAYFAWFQLAQVAVWTGWLNHQAPEAGYQAEAHAHPCRTKA